MKSTRFSRPKGHFGTCLTFSVPFGILGFFAAFLLHHSALGVDLLAYSVATRMVMAVAISTLIVKERQLGRTALLFPLRDLLGFFYWAASYLDNRIVWRNQHYTLAKGGFMLSPDSENETKNAPAFPA